MHLINEKMKSLIKDIQLENVMLRQLLEKRTGIFSTEIIAFEDMILWNERNWSIEMFQKARWDRMMKLWHNIKSQIEFFGYNRIYLHDEFMDLSKDDILCIGCICFNYWKEHLQKQFPDYHFFIRFYYQEYENGDFESAVAFHKVRTNEALGTSELLKRPNPAIMISVI